MVAPIVILKVVLNVFGFVVSFESIRNAFILGILIGLVLMIISMAIPTTKNYSIKTTIQ